ncbi:hypothetical protein [Bordetella genomosp. 9]
MPRLPAAAGRFRAAGPWRHGPAAGMAAALLLAGCANIAHTPPGTPLPEMTARYGQPSYTCNRPDGTRRVVWSQQPSGSAAWGTDLDSQGRALRMEELLTPEHFQRLKQGDWTPEAVRCEFGPPAQIRAVGLGDKYEVVWSYRYVLDGRWHSVMYVYLGPRGDRVTHYHSGPDDRYQRSE